MKPKKRWGQVGGSIICNSTESLPEGLFKRHMEKNPSSAKLNNDGVKKLKKDQGCRLESLIGSFKHPTASPNESNHDHALFSFMRQDTRSKSPPKTERERIEAKYDQMIEWKQRQVGTGELTSNGFMRKHDQLLKEK